MERARLLEHLAAARRHADEGQIRLLKQKQLIATLGASGEDTAAAETGLHILEETQHNHLDLIERLQDALNKISVTHYDAQS
jgi:hypothetical protein